MAKAAKRESSMVLTAGLLIAALAIAFALAWYYMKNASKHRPDVAYAPFNQVVVRAPEYSIAANFVLQTSPDDASWVAKHQKELEVVLKAALNNADPQMVRSPDGLLALQLSLKNIGNTALKTEKIQQVLFTDFIIQSN